VKPLDAVPPLHRLTLLRSQPLEMFAADPCHQALADLGHRMAPAEASGHQTVEQKWGSAMESSVRAIHEGLDSKMVSYMDRWAVEMGFTPGTSHTPASVLSGIKKAMDAAANPTAHTKPPKFDLEVMKNEIRELLQLPSTMSDNALFAALQAAVAESGLLTPYTPVALSAAIRGAYEQLPAEVRAWAILIGNQLGVDGQAAARDPSILLAALRKAFNASGPERYKFDVIRAQIRNFCGLPADASDAAILEAFVKKLDQAGPLTPASAFSAGAISPLSSQAQLAGIRAYQKVDGCDFTTAYNRLRALLPQIFNPGVQTFSAGIGAAPGDRGAELAEMVRERRRSMGLNFEQAFNSLRAERPELFR
jgi:hypothetical protein